MSMITSVTSEILLATLNSLDANQKVIASNIANHKTEGYKKKQMVFETHISELLDQLKNARNDIEINRLVSNYDKKLTAGELIEDSPDNSVELDVEMMNLTQNLLKYQALIDGMSKRSAVLKMAIKGKEG